MMSASQNDMIAAEFLRIAAELDDEGANPYRIRAYRRAAGIIARLMEDAGADKAIATLNGSQLDGRTLTVNEARPMVKRDFGGGGGDF